MRGHAPSQREAFERNDFWLWCPLSSDMCLIGSSKPLSSDTTPEMKPEHITEIQILTRDQGRVFLVSPVRLARFGNRHPAVEPAILRVLL